MTNRLLGLVVTFTAVLLLAVAGARRRRARLEVERAQALGALEEAATGERGGRRRRRRSARQALVAAEAGEGTAPESGDDLKLIEGVGPRMEQVLLGAGIRTFQQLADSNPEQLVEAMRSAGARLTDPATWPEQARLAAEGRWDDLRTLQGELKGGRRIEGTDA